MARDEIKELYSQLLEQRLQEEVKKRQFPSEPVGDAYFDKLMHKYGDAKLLGVKGKIKVYSYNRGNEGSSTDVVKDGKLIADGDYDRDASCFFIDKDTYNTVDEILKAFN
jgi:hypothetical protein